MYCFRLLRFLSLFFMSNKKALSSTTLFGICKSITQVDSKDVLYDEINVTQFDILISF